MTCKHLVYRSKNYIKHPYCRLNREWQPNCTKECFKPREYKELVAKTPLKQSDKPITKKTTKQRKLEDNRYSILTNDLDHCIECKEKGIERTSVNFHEIYYGSKHRHLSIKNGLVIPLCTCEHHKMNVEGIHKDKELDLKWKQIGQAKFDELNGKGEFEKIFGRNYIKE